jgi:hypothetical protein
MNARKRRKIHARYIEWAVLILQDPVFHHALSRTPIDAPWLLNRETLRHLPRRWVRPFRRWNLRYGAARVVSIPGWPHHEADTSIPFKVWALDAPTRPTWTFNSIEYSTSFAEPDEQIDTSFVPTSDRVD